jgi:site-specific recombinase XerC
MSKLIKFISKDDFDKVLKDESDKDFKLAYVLAFGSGLRISEIVGASKRSNQDIRALTKEQVDLQAHQIKVFGKGGKERITVINPVYPIKDSMLSLLPLRIPRTTLQRRFRVACKKVLGKSLNFHTLRHGFANYMINDKGYPLPMVQGFGGWSRLDTVGIYAKANPQASISKVWEGF